MKLHISAQLVRWLRLLVRDEHLDPSGSKKSAGRCSALVTIRLRPASQLRLRSQISDPSGAASNTRPASEWPRQGQGVAPSYVIRVLRLTLLSPGSWRRSSMGAAGGAAAG